MTRQRILITGASSGLGAGMARAFAAKGRDLALCARRLDRLLALKAELSQRYRGIVIAVAELDVDDHENVPAVFAALAGELGGLDRVIVNAGIGKGAPLGTGKLWANKATIETNLVSALVQIETALEIFKKQGSGHLVLISSVLGNKGVAGAKAAYSASKAGVSSLGESLRAEYASGPIRVTVIEPGYIESEMTARTAKTMLLVDNETGVAKMVDAVERERGRAIVPRWPWVPLVAMLKMLPPRYQTFRLIGGTRLACGSPNPAVLSGRASARLRLTEPGRAPRDSGGPAHRLSCPTASAARRPR